MQVALQNEKLAAVLYYTCHAWRGLCVVVGGERVQPAAAGGSTEREASGGGHGSQSGGQAGGHGGLSTAEGARGRQRQGRPDRTAH